jgi:hypothetical protein
MLIVEDGTGLADANAYIDIDFVDNYLIGDQLTAWEALTEPEQESAIIKATRFIDLMDWKGTRKTLEQALEWPRLGVEYQGFEIEGLPNPVKKATAEAVYVVLNTPELYNQSSDKEVIK